MRQDVTGLVAKLEPDSTGDLLAEWRWLIPYPSDVFMVSAIGDAFFTDAKGLVYWLDVGCAECSFIANSKEEFRRLCQREDFLSDVLGASLVHELKSVGKSLHHGQCYSPTIPMTLNGQFQLSNYDVADISKHFVGMGKIQRQVKALPLGTRITSVELEE